MVTSRTIFQYHNEIENWKQTGSALYYFNLPQINSFYKKYNKQLNIVSGRINDLAGKYFETEEIKGIKQIKKNPEGKEILRDGLSGADYRIELDEILNGVCLA